MTIKRATEADRLVSSQDVMTKKVEKYSIGCSSRWFAYRHSRHDAGSEIRITGDRISFRVDTTGWALRASAHWSADAPREGGWRQKEVVDQRDGFHFCWHHD